MVVMHRLRCDLRFKSSGASIHRSVSPLEAVTVMSSGRDVGKLAMLTMKNFALPTVRHGFCRMRLPNSFLLDRTRPALWSTLFEEEGTPLCSAVL